jgi:hypothetical protein
VRQRTWELLTRFVCYLFKESLENLGGITQTLIPQFSPPPYLSAEVMTMSLRRDHRSVRLYRTSSADTLRRASRRSFHSQRWPEPFGRADRCCSLTYLASVRRSASPTSWTYSRHVVFTSMPDTAHILYLYPQIMSITPQPLKDSMRS